jgi:ferredoxin
MKILLLVHSSTGNTRLVARFAARHLERQGHDVLFAGKGPEPPPDPRGFDLVGVASPTMYFRPMLAVESWLERLPDRPDEHRPAFLLATCAGEPGAHFELQARQLARKGLRTVDAHWVPMPSNWPPHRVLSRHLEPALPLGRLLSTGPLRPLRVGWGFLWTELTEPDARDRAELEAFLDRLPKHCRTAADTAPDRLYQPWLPGTGYVGRTIGPREMRKATQVRIDSAACRRCGACVRACPSGCLGKPEADRPPVVGDGCTGCWACYNRCPHGALAGWATPAGTGRYRGPSPATRALFDAPAEPDAG